MVRKGGFEPPRLSAPPPQDGVSASSTTSARSKPSGLNMLPARTARGLGYDSIMVNFREHSDLHSWFLASVFAAVALVGSASRAAAADVSASQSVADADNAFADLNDSYGVASAIDSALFT